MEPLPTNHHFLPQPGQSYYTIRKHLFHTLLSPTEGPPPPLPDPTVTGILPDDTQDLLWGLVSDIGMLWEIQSYSNLDEETFKDYLSLKTTLVPSYYTAYMMAQSIYQELVTEYGSQSAPEYFYTPDGGNTLPNWDIVRQWVIKEFLVIYVTRGAFRAYGWLNYAGYGGGPFNNPSDLPYRPYIPPKQ